MENEKRMRREIANSNERRRMQSINAGFQSLRSLLPHHEGEKLSKVSARRNTFLLYKTEQNKTAHTQIRKKNETIGKNFFLYAL